MTRKKQAEIKAGMARSTTIVDQRVRKQIEAITGPDWQSIGERYAMD